jgi:hypothetical protein
MQGVNHFCERHPLGSPTCWHNATQDELRRLGIAIQLSGGNLAICEALLRGETVPSSALNPDQLQRLK